MLSSENSDLKLLLITYSTLTNCLIFKNTKSTILNIKFEVIYNKKRNSKICSKRKAFISYIVNDCLLIASSFVIPGLISVSAFWVFWTGCMAPTRFSAAHVPTIATWWCWACYQCETPSPTTPNTRRPEQKSNSSSCLDAPLQIHLENWYHRRRLHSQTHSRALFSLLRYFLPCATLGSQSEKNKTEKLILVFNCWCYNVLLIFKRLWIYHIIQLYFNRRAHTIDV